ncbi:MAG TPA: pilus assembly protein [Candidatus Aphodovivens avicola]|nr:pilus assembly protein [Candidatus Aphodovivens avicola]
MRSSRRRITYRWRLPGRWRTSCCTDRTESGQGTVEAAFALPVLMVLLLLLIQPGIVLYDRMVMQAAAAEGCRLLATSTDSLGAMDEACEAFVRHRLGSVPQQECFHVHEGANGCSWRIQLIGDESSETVEVRIENELRPLPLLDAASALLDLVNEDGNLVIEVSATAPVQPEWARDAFSSRAPEDLVGAWLE